MLPEGEGAVSRWIGDFKDGDQAAAQPLWERYFDRLVRLAGARLRSAQPRLSADADGEDAALSAFDSFCAGAVRGRFPQLADRDDLWRLLVVITARKVQAQARRQRRRNRGGGLDRNESDLPEAGCAPGAQCFDRIVGDEPTPAFAAQVAEECRRLLDALGDESLCLVALARMEGYTTGEIAEQVTAERETETVEEFFENIKPD